MRKHQKDNLENALKDCHNIVIPLDDISALRCRQKRRPIAKEIACYGVKKIQQIYQVYVFFYIWRSSNNLIKERKQCQTHCGNKKANGCIRLSIIVHYGSYLVLIFLRQRFIKCIYDRTTNSQLSQ